MNRQSYDRLAPNGLGAWNHVVERGHDGYVAKDETSAYEGGPTKPRRKVKQKGLTVEGDRWQRRISVAPGRPVMRRDVAEELNQITIECTERMGRARDIVMVNRRGDELKKCMRNIAEVLAAITMFAGPIYAEYPDLTPPQLRDQGGHE